MKDIENRVFEIEARNKRVEMDKKWETSWTRRIAISVLTYVVIVAYLITIENERPYVNALVPAIGFLLSTLVLKSIRSIWQK